MKDPKKIIEDIQRQRYELRAQILAEMKINPTLEHSEVLRKVDGDIIFWNEQNDFSLEGMLKTLRRSFDELE